MIYYLYILKGRMFMTLNTIFQPALYVMNKLRFKIKIILSISILFILLLIPSRTLFINNMDQNAQYDQQLIGLEYMEIISSFIKTVTVHRTLALEYLESKSNSDKLEELEEIELKFDKQKETIMNFDEKHFQYLSSNQNFSKAIGYFMIMKQDKFDNKITAKFIFDTHGKVIAGLMDTLQNIAKVSTFSTSKDLRINYLAGMLQYKLISLYDFTRQLKDTSFTQINSIEMLKADKLALYSLWTDLSSLKLHLKNNELLSHLDNYQGLEEKATEVTYKIKKLLKILDNQIINNNSNKVYSKEFFNKVFDATESQNELFDMFSYTYQETIHQLIADLQEELWSFLIMFLIIVLSAFYIFITFYQSITGNLKKLQTASELISIGQTKIYLEVDKQDEIGDALLAFNSMSETLHKNISFLDGYKMAIDNSSIVSKTDLKGIITYANEMFCEVSGYTQQELIGRSHNIVRHPDVPKETFYEMWKTIKNKKVWKGIVPNISKNGETYIVDATILPILDHNGDIIEYFAVRHDITELEKSKKEIQKQRMDLLTKLPNRNQLMVDLKSAVKPIIFYLNIDNFSGFNDFYGSDMGDLVLVNLAKTLSGLNINREFNLYKLQADQFILLFQEKDLEKQNFQYFFQALLDDIENDILNLNVKNQNRINISVSAGVATYYAHDNYQNLILYANIARKKARQAHKKFLLFDHTMRKSEDYAKNIEWIKKIKEAIKNDRITTYYQPIIDNKTEKIEKYETLVRMLDRDGHPVLTWEFLEIAQKAKLYPQVTKIVIDKAFKTFEKLPHIEFSLNLTIDDILSKSTTDYIYKKLENYEHTQRVIFEITESEEVSDYKVINEFIKGVKKYGVKIAIDDFGSGYANFDHIINIDADFIKIDGSLIKNIDTDKNAKIITEAIIMFSNKLGKKTITEYIHNKEVFDIVKSLGADYSQGFYLGEPSPKLLS